MSTIKTYLERIRDPRQLLGDCLVCGRRRLVVVLVGEPPEEGGHLVVVEVGEVDLVGGADLAQPLEHGRRRSHPDWGLGPGAVLSPVSHLCSWRLVTALLPGAASRRHTDTVTWQQHNSSTYFQHNVWPVRACLHHCLESIARLISQSAESTKINIHQMESISTNVMIMNDVCGKSVSLSLHPESILGQFHLASQVVWHLLRH